jgi:hypothetical protein
VGRADVSAMAGSERFDDPVDGDAALGAGLVGSDLAGASGSERRIA